MRTLRGIHVHTAHVLNTSRLLEIKGEFIQDQVQIQVFLIKDVIFYNLLEKSPPPPFLVTLLLQMSNFRYVMLYSFSCAGSKSGLEF